MSWKCEELDEENVQRNVTKQEAYKDGWKVMTEIELTEPAMTW